MEKQIEIHLLGILRLFREGQPINGIRSRKALALLGYLATHDHALLRTHLVDLFWSEMPEARGRANLSWVINHLNESLPNLIVADRHSVGLRQDGELYLDTREFSVLTQQSELNPNVELSLDALNRAIVLYRGDFMGGHYLSDCPTFEQWLLHQQESWRQRIFKVLNRLSAHHQQRGEEEAALRVVEQWLNLAPWQEEAHQRKMELLAASGQWSSALQQFELCRRLLKDELGVAPGAEISALYERIRQRDGKLVRVRAESTKDNPPESSATPMQLALLETLAHAKTSLPLPHNLQRQFSSFVGRQSEIDQIVAMLNEENCKLVTLFGPGGIGKTRLALAVAQKVVESMGASQNSQSAIRNSKFPDGIWFVPLEAVDEAARLPQAVAMSLGLQFGGNMAARQVVVDYLHGKKLLLVMDNYEHLLPDSALITEIVHSNSGIKVLTTSRQRLNLPFERIFEVEGLSHRNHAASNGRDNVAPALRLFLERTERFSHVLAETSNLAHIERICQLVEGFPLGIELAAGLVSFMPLSEIVTELASDLDLLSAPSIAPVLHDPSNALPHRHQSLRTVFETSWKLLRAQEQQVLTRLAIFRGGFDWQAVKAVARPTGAELAVLINKSLLRLNHATVHGESRYEMHELLRQYAVERMIDGEMIAAVHANYFGEFVYMREGALMTGGQKLALNEIGRELENIRAAWNWAVARSNRALLGKFCRGLALYFDMRGPADEAEVMFGRAVTVLRQHNGQTLTQEDEVILLRLLVQQARLCRVSNNHGRTKAILNEALTISQRPEFSSNQAVQLQRAEALNLLGRLLHYLGENEFAQQTLESSLVLSQGESAAWVRAETLGFLGSVVQFRGQAQRAEELYQASLTIRRNLGDLHGATLVLSLLGFLCVNKTEHVRAELLLQESLAIWRELGDRNGEANTLNSLGANAVTAGDYVAAKRYHLESLALYRADNHKPGVLRNLSNLGLVYNRLGEYQKALEVLHSAMELEHALNSPRSTAFTLRHIGESHLRLNNFAEARRSFQQALMIALKIGEIPLALLVINAMTQLWIATGQSERATEHLGMILAHPATERKVIQQAERTLSEIALMVSAQKIEETLARGKEMVLEDAAKAIINETATN